jgi:hypothetical protein
MNKFIVCLVALGLSAASFAGKAQAFASELRCRGYNVVLTGDLISESDLANATIQYFFNGRGAKATGTTEEKSLPGTPNIHGRIYKDYNIFHLSDRNSFLLPINVTSIDGEFSTRFNFAAGNDGPGTSSSMTCKVNTCGQIEELGSSLTFTQTLKDGKELQGGIYPSPSLSTEEQREINLRLHAYVNFREVCVLETPNSRKERETAVVKIVSAQE